MKVLFIFVLLLFFQNLYAQNSVSCDSIYEKPDSMAFYQKNISHSYIDFVREKVVPAIPKSCQMPSSLRFILTIDKEGKIIDVVFLTQLPKTCSEELRKKILELPLWNPAQHQGKKVCSCFPIIIGCIKWRE